MALFQNKQRHRHHVRMIVSVFAERNGSFLFLHERRRTHQAINEPVGHVEPGESILAAAQREFFEETGYHVRLRHLVGIYYNIYSRPTVSDSIRFAFLGAVIEGNERRPTPKKINAFWVKRNELRRFLPRLSHPTTRRALKDLLAGKRLPANALTELRFPRQPIRKPTP